MRVYVVVCFKIVGNERIFVNAGVFNVVSDAVTFGKNYDDSIVIDRMIE